MKWICWICGRENPFRPLKAVQDKCPKCGDELRTGRAPLATTTNIAGFLLILGAVVTVPADAAVAFAGVNPGDTIVAGVTMGVTAFVDPFVGMLAGIVLKVLFGFGLGL